ncbi:cell division protein ZapA [Saliterribacillus persicus]|uniref:Cell division protein ZapA n=1 Tax=Saliterribacillus persicus TaxID=930114 RepID=A0A368XFD4_9BACI|nr:cell division protein ZapA [Saliterribacillus persicus]RCW66349.1 cell division protein ZapA [Saliterribacillus persicus]
MSNNKKERTTVTIYGRSYTVIGEEGVEQMRHVAQLVDDKLNEIHTVNKSLDTTSLAVLTALNTMNDYIKLKEEYEVLQNLLEEKEE